MRKLEVILFSLSLCLVLPGCGDVTVNRPAAKPTVIIEEKRDRPIIIEKTTVEKPIIIEKTRIEHK